MEEHHAVGVILGVTFPAWGASFREIPPVAWAHTLHGGELLLGTTLFLSFGGHASYALEVAFGLTNDLQVGLGWTYGWLGNRDFLAWTLGGKGRLNLGSNLALGFPVSVSFLEEQHMGIAFGHLSGGAVVSLRMGDLALHGELDLFHTRYGSFMLCALALEYDLGLALKVGVKAD